MITFTFASGKPSDLPTIRDVVKQYDPSQGLMFQEFSGRVVPKSQWDELTDVAFDGKQFTRAYYAYAGDALKVYGPLAKQQELETELEQRKAELMIPQSATFEQAPTALINEEQLIARLESGTAIIKYTKLDGSATTMVATLARGLIPEQHRPRTPAPHDDTKGVLSVYAMDRNGWRSLRFDRITEVIPK